MTAEELRQKYLNFFVQKGHKVIPSAPLVPENDPSVLFTTAGMHPLVPFLLGQPHPEGKRLTNVQKCVRTGDIDEVGDTTHHTFFEMLGNWSLGDYFKKEAIEWSHQFLTSPDELNIPKDKLAISVFKGDADAPFDEESFNIWKSLGVPEERIAKLPKSDNWWGPAGETGPCGPDTEMFVWTGENPIPDKFDPEDKNWVEIWNDVFMEFNKNSEGKFEPLEQKNVDTGMGLERTLAVLNGFNDDYQTELFAPIIETIVQLTGKNYEENLVAFRIVADHLKAATFLISEGVKPSNKEHGYVLRRLLRRAATKAFLMDKQKSDSKFFRSLIKSVIDIYPEYFEEVNVVDIEEEASLEIRKFRATLERGLQRLDKSIKDNENLGLAVFNLSQSYGYPLELTIELLKERGIEFSDFDMEQFKRAMKSHIELSRTASAGMFKGGLGEQTEVTTKYHTATHLLHAALRQVLGAHVQQKGSNITAERLRFDFSQPEKLTENQIKEVDNLVNEAIQKNLPVTSEIMDKEAALESGALGFFTEKYGDKVTVYTIGNPSTPAGRSGPPFSREICGGPHIKNTGELGKFTITKEESAGAGVRRIYATLN